ncbi:MAG: restriction endonuclease subunit S [Leptospiraceae bacterium]|nr:restriction endonuclease subunit S [Leptospiraceae bacterium]
MLRLIDLATIHSGFKIHESDYRQAGVRVLTASDIKDFNSILITENRFVEPTDKNDKHLLEQGDILMVSVGSKVGNVAIFQGDEPTIANQNLLVIKPLDDPHELLDKLVKKKSRIVKLSKGKAMQCIVIKDLGEVEL